MRIFDTWRFNRADIRFKDTLAFLKDLLSQQGIGFQSLSFYAQGAESETFDRAQTAFDFLKSYRVEDSFSNMRYTEDGIEHTPLGEHEETALEAFLSKIPRPYNFGFVGAMIDGLSFGGAPTPAPCDGNLDDCQKLHFACYYSNSLRVFKEWSFGNKRNIIELMMERTVDGNRLEPLSPEVQSLIDALGKPIATERWVVSDKQQMRQWRSACERMKAEQHERRSEYDPLFEALVDNRPVTADTIADKATARLQPMKGVSPKTVLTRVAKANGYRAQSGSREVHSYIVQNEHHHRISVTFFLTTIGSAVSAHVVAEGYNFFVPLAMSPEVIVRDEEALEQFACAVFAMAKDVRAKREGTLDDAFGETPMWYHENFS